MSTNYYLATGNTVKGCECLNCNCRAPEVLHVGLSAGGWCFQLHVLEGLECWDCWKTYLRERAKLFGGVGPARLFDENDREIDVEWFIKDLETTHLSLRPVSKEEAQQRARRVFPPAYGPGNYLRSDFDGQHCVGHHPELAIDYIQGEFS